MIAFGRAKQRNLMRKILNRYSIQPALTSLIHLFASTLIIFAQPLLASGTPKISELTPLDIQYIRTQKSAIQETARSVGQNFTGHVENDIALLQRLLDSKKIVRTMTLELQAMGFILGDLLANELDMHWVIYHDTYGRSRALRYKDSENYLFPVTMISRRREVNNLTSVRNIYNKAYETIDPLRDPIPFQ